MEHKTTKGTLFFLLLLIVSFPLLQQSFPFFESGLLRGAVTGTANPGFNWNKWWDGSCQRQKNDYLNDSTGCRADMVRLNNQLDFWLFKKRHARQVVIGKDECLFEQAYIDEYYGLDYTGENKMNKAVTQLKKIQDTLERLGKTFVFLYAPSKAYYFADKLPDRPIGSLPGAPTSYATFKRLADAEGIRQIDYNAWFSSMKSNSPGQLLSPLGIHWTVYGSLVAADTFIKYLEHARNISMPELRWKEITQTHIPRKTDDDLWAGLNLIFPNFSEQFSYPEFSYDHKGNKAMPQILYIGDSFLWVWRYDSLMQNISNDFNIFYYFTEDWNKNTLANKEPPVNVDDIDWHSKLLSSDCVAIMYVPSGFRKFTEAGGPIRKLYDFFYPERRYNNIQAESE